MWSRRDQIQAYQFIRRRTVSAVLLGDANNAFSPTRRPVIGLITGIVVTILVVVGFVLYGVLRPGGSTAWRAQAAIVQERESGARFVLSKDGVLHPVANYASARLVVGQPGKLVRVARKSLDTVGRGPAIGIPGAPDALPTAKRMLAEPWTACSARASDAGPGEPAGLAVIVGAASGASRVVLGPGAALVAQTGSEIYVVTDGRKFRVRSQEPQRILLGLGLGQAPQTVVDPSWLATVPSGPDLGYLDITRRGEVSAALPGVETRVGQIFVLRTAGSSGEQFFVLLIDGLAPIATTQARLVLADPRTTEAYPGAEVAALELQPAALAAGVASVTDLDREQYPATAPETLTFSPGEDVVLCSRSEGFRSGAPAVELTLSFAVPAPAGVRPLTQPVPGREPFSAQVYVAAGAGALVQAVPADGVTTGAVYLVTDEGRRYAVADADSRAALGLATVPPVPLPAQFIEILPAGPSLSRAAASGTFNAAAPPG